MRRHRGALALGSMAPRLADTPSWQGHCSSSETPGAVPNWPGKGAVLALEEHTYMCENNSSWGFETAQSAFCLRRTTGPEGNNLQEGAYILPVASLVNKIVGA